MESFKQDKRPASEIQTIRDYIEDNRKRRKERRYELNRSIEEYNRKVDSIIDSLTTEDR